MYYREPQTPSRVLRCMRILAWTIMVVMVLAALASTKRAHALPVRCETVKYYVAVYGLEQAIEWARKRGWSWNLIRQAQSTCLQR